jgi:hypothetical protein
MSQLRTRFLAAAAIVVGTALIQIHPATSQGQPVAGSRAATPVGSHWPRPKLVNPITIRLTTGSQILHLSDTRDYILSMPSVKKTGTLRVYGGHNVELIGGYFSTKVSGPNIEISDDPGTIPGRVVHVEGLLIDGSSQVPSDGIRIQAPHTIVQIENCRIIGLLGSLAGFHADVIQGSLGFMALRIDGLTGSSHYNDLYLRRQTNPLAPAIGTVDIRNANLGGYSNPAKAPPRTIRGISLGTQASPPGDHSQSINCKLTSPVILENYYVDPPPGAGLGQFVFPDSAMKGGAGWCKAVVAPNGASVDWPGLRAVYGGFVSGTIKLGPPPGGDFVPSGTAGIGYH